MCTYSMVSDWGRKKFWPTVPVTPIQPFDPSGQLIPAPSDPAIVEELREQREMIQKFMAMLEAAKAFDKASGQPDCEEESKTAWLSEVKERLGKIEQRLGIAGGAI